MPRKSELERCADHAVVAGYRIQLFANYGFKGRYIEGASVVSVSRNHQIKQRYNFLPYLDIVRILSNSKRLLKVLLKELRTFQPPVRGPCQLIKGVEMLPLGTKFFAVRTAILN